MQITNFGLSMSITNSDTTPYPNNSSSSTSLNASLESANSQVNLNPATALEKYKKKDLSKGTLESSLTFNFPSFWLLICFLIFHVKVVVRFRAIGNAPILKQNFYKITASNKFQAVILFLRKELNYKASDPLVNFLLNYMNVIYYLRSPIHSNSWLSLLNRIVFIY